ncbi:MULTISPECIES: hypothetical protein [Bacillaceae]|uniref:hypothetical protein n=1 Tax=Anoxybacillaceae TaxID=3120669 RepID=UPI0018F1627C|nr:MULTISPECIES: hypothetical protein [Bacillaceae]GLH62649.1 hypothetical protein PG301_04890 [Parageobacillus sp. G301]
MEIGISFELDETEELKQKNRVEIQGSVQRKQYLQALLKENWYYVKKMDTLNREK